MHGLVDLGLGEPLPPKDTMTFRDEGEISYALGKQGGTRQFCGVFHLFAILWKGSQSMETRSSQDQFSKSCMPD